MVASNPGVSALIPGPSPYDAPVRVVPRRVSRPAQRDRDTRNATIRRDRLLARECSIVWADDLFYGRDRDCYGQRTGHGQRKVACCDCGRWVPPQDVAVICDPSAAWRADQARGIHGLPPPPLVICCDCRTITPADRSAEPDVDDLVVYRGVALQRIDLEYRGEYGPVPFVAVGESDGSPSAVVMDAMADRDVVLTDDELPTENTADLAAAVEAFRGDGDLENFRVATGDARKRYGANRPIRL